MCGKPLSPRARSGNRAELLCPRHLSSERVWAPVQECFHPQAQNQRGRQWPRVRHPWQVTASPETQGWGTFAVGYCTSLGPRGERRGSAEPAGSLGPSVQGVTCRLPQSTSLVRAAPWWPHREGLLLPQATWAGNWVGLGDARGVSLGLLCVCGQKDRQDRSREVRDGEQAEPSQLGSHT